MMNLDTQIKYKLICVYPYSTRKTVSEQRTKAEQLLFCLQLCKKLDLIN